jgi:CO dehydrogenase/CO-methylating acetyl-CoA synthase complex beta subunit
MQLDFEPVLERQIHYFTNAASGLQHIGQRDIVWMRIAKTAAEKGFTLRHIGDILHARMHADFGAIVDKVQVKIITEPGMHAEWLEKARESYSYRNERMADMTDEAVDTFYSCILCQSFAPDHVCVISPQRLGLCGAYNWLDCKASYEINPTGPNQPIIKGQVINEEIGYWAGTNEYALQASHGAVPKVSMYSIMTNPMTACGCFECIVMYIPEVNGVAVISREDPGMTPAGMKFSTLAGICGGGLQNPGMMGVGKYYILSPKFISADGGFKRIVWMSTDLKQSMQAELQTVAEREGDPDLISRIADGNTVVEVDDLIKWVKEHDHPVLNMPPMQTVEDEEAVAEAPVSEVRVFEQEQPVQEPLMEVPSPEPEPVIALAEVAAVPEPEMVPETPLQPSPQLSTDLDVKTIAQMTADMVLTRMQNALVAALRELGGAVPAQVPAVAPSPTVVVPEEIAAPTPAEESSAPFEQAPEPVVSAVERVEAPMFTPDIPRKIRKQSLGSPWIKAEGSDFSLHKEKWTGKVLEVTLGATSEQGGSRAKTLTIGGETTLPYQFYEGSVLHRPAIAIEIMDRKPDDWSPLLMKTWGDVMNDPATWAKAAEEKGVDAVLLRLSATRADGSPNSEADVRATVRTVLSATGLPLIVYGPGQVELDNEFLVAVAEEGKGERLLLGLCEEKNYRTIVATALANDQLVIASTAMDVNLAKQLNILISDMGMPLDRIITDPTCAAVGYGIEYGYSVMERLRLAALTGDKMTQLPMILTVGYEAWRQKEAKVGEGVPSAWGDWEERAINWETLTAAPLVLSGANLLVLRHPKTVKRVQTMINQLMIGIN